VTMPGLKLRLFRQGAVISLLCLVILAALYVAGVFTPVDLKIQDLWFRLRGGREASDKIAIVEIDDVTIAAYGQWPLPRDTYALLLSALEDAGVKAVGFDLLFLDPDKQNQLNDVLLASLTGMYPNVVHAIAFLPEAPTGGELGGAPQEQSEGLSRHGMADDLPMAMTAGSVCVPIEPLLDAAPALGHTTVTVDRDGAIRRVPLVIRYGRRVYPALGLRLSWFARDEGVPPRLGATEHGILMSWPDGHAIEVPVDDEGSTAVDFAGDHRAFPRVYGMLDVLHWYQEGNSEALSEAFAGRLVLIGNTAVGEVATDVGTTPFATMTPLVYVHANLIDGLLGERFIRRIPRYLYISGLIGLSILLAWVCIHFSLPVAAAVAGGIVGGIAMLEFLLFAVVDIEVPPLLPLLLPPLAYASIASYRFVFLEGKARESAKELQVARAIQLRLLPAAPPQIAELDVFGINIPAKEVGGDYYDWLPMTDGSLAVVVGDVSGKGVSSSLLMSHLHASLHAEVRGVVNPKAIIEAMNLSFCSAIETGRFATFFLCVIDYVQGRLTYCNAGHDPVVLVLSGKVERLEPSGMPLGIFEDAEYSEETRPFCTGDVLLLCSDGVTECDRRGELYGGERLLELVGSLGADLTAEDTAGAILKDIGSFCRSQEYADDVTIVVVRHR
jgi:CHASE2 domain-containing sensor protein